MEVEKSILEYPVVDKPDVIAKARFMANRDWCEGAENLAVFEYLLNSFEKIG